MARMSIVLVSGFALLANSMVPSLSEVSSAHPDTSPGVVVMAREGDPPAAVWRAVRPAGSLVLNAEGESRGDIDPVIGIDPLTGLPEAVWAFWDGGDFELAWSRFDGTSWSPPVMLTDDTVDDTTPCLSFSAAGDLAIAWTRHDMPSRIWYIERDPVFGWSDPIPVSDGTLAASSCSITWDNETPHVGFQENTGEGLRRILMASSGNSPDPWPFGFVLDLVAVTAWTGDLEQDTRTIRGTVYIVWVDSASELAFSTFRAGSWSPPGFEPYAGPQDIGRAKIRVRTRVARGE